MIQKILIYSYIILGVASFCYWISALLSAFRMLMNRKPGLSIFRVATTGILNKNNFTYEGNHQRQKLQNAMIKFFMVIAAMILVVFIGAQTQT